MSWDSLLHTDYLEMPGSSIKESSPRKRKEWKWPDVVTACEKRSMGDESIADANHTDSGYYSAAKCCHTQEPKSSPRSLKMEQLKHPRRYCQVEGCNRIVKSQRLCQRHGAKTKKCKFENCSKQAQGNFDGMCKLHYRKVYPYIEPEPFVTTTTSDIYESEFSVDHQFPNSSYANESYPNCFPCLQVQPYYGTSNPIFPVYQAYDGYNIPIAPPLSPYSFDTESSIYYHRQQSNRSNHGYQYVTSINTSPYSNTFHGTIHSSYGPRDDYVNTSTSDMLPPTLAAHVRKAEDQIWRNSNTTDQTSCKHSTKITSMVSSMDSSERSDMISIENPMEHGRALTYEV